MNRTQFEEFTASANRSLGQLILFIFLSPLTIMHSRFSISVVASHAISLELIKPIIYFYFSSLRIYKLFWVASPMQF